MVFKATFNIILVMS